MVFIVQKVDPYIDWFILTLCHVCCLINGLSMHSKPWTVLFGTPPPLSPPPPTPLEISAQAYNFITF